MRKQQTNPPQSQSQLGQYTQNSSNKNSLLGNQSQINPHANNIQIENSSNITAQNLSQQSQVTQGVQSKNQVQNQFTASRQKMTSPSNEQSNKFPFQSKSTLGNRDQLSGNYQTQREEIKQSNLSKLGQNTNSKQQIQNNRNGVGYQQQQQQQANHNNVVTEGMRVSSQLSIQTTISNRQSNPVNSNQTNTKNGINNETKLTIQSPKAQFLIGHNQGSSTQPNNQNSSATTQISPTIFNPEKQTLQNQKNLAFSFGKQNPQSSINNKVMGNLPSTTKNSFQTNKNGTQASGNKQAADKGYKSFIQIANKKDGTQVSRTANTSPVVNKYLNQNNFDNNNKLSQGYPVNSNGNNGANINGGQVSRYPQPGQSQNTNLALELQKLPPSATPQPTFSQSLTNNQPKVQTQKYQSNQSSQQQNSNSTNLNNNQTVNNSLSNGQSVSVLGVSQSQKVSPARNVSPGEKIVIKKSEIKFKNSNNSLSNVDSSNQLKNQNNNALNNKIEQNQQQVSNLVSTQKQSIPFQESNQLPISGRNGNDLQTSGKQLAFDFIKNMLSHNQNNQASVLHHGQNDYQDYQSSPNQPGNHDQSNSNLQNQIQNGILKKKFQKFGSPGINHNKTLKKQNVNFVHDMKKHGIQKDIDSVKAMRYFLENSPVQSENNSLIDISQQNNNPSDILNNYGFDNSKDSLQQNLNEIKDNTTENKKELAIDTGSKLDPKMIDEDKKISPSNENNYIFPFQRRARSLSPPKENNLGENSQNSQGSLNMDSPNSNIVASFKFPNDSALNKLHLHVNNQNNATNQQQAQGSQGKHNRVNSGPIIPDRNCIEKVIKHTPGIFFGMGPHLKQYHDLRQEQQYLEMEEKILKGQESDEWAAILNEEVERVNQGRNNQENGGVGGNITTGATGILNQQEQENKIYHTDQKGADAQMERGSVISNKDHLRASAIKGNTSLGMGGGTGFLGDEDDVEDEDVEQDNDDWMFQTFEKQKKQKARSQHVKQTQQKKGTLNLNADKIMNRLSPTQNKNDDNQIQNGQISPLHSDEDDEANFNENDCELVDFDHQQLLQQEDEEYMNFFKDEIRGNFSPSRIDNHQPFYQQSKRINECIQVNPNIQNDEEFFGNTQINESTKNITGKNSIQNSQQQLSYTSMLDKWLSKMN